MACLWGLKQPLANDDWQSFGAIQSYLLVLIKLLLALSAIDFHCLLRPFLVDLWSPLCVVTKGVLLIKALPQGVLDDQQASACLLGLECDKVKVKDRTAGCRRVHNAPGRNEAINDGHSVRLVWTGISLQRCDAACIAQGPSVKMNR